MTTLTTYEPPALPSEAGRRRAQAESLDAALAAAMEQARQAGLAAGRREVEAAVAGHEAARAQLERSLGLVQQALAQLHRQDALALDDLAGHVVALAIELAEGIVGRELRDVDSALADALRRGLAMAPDRGDVLVRVHPDDVAAAAALVDASPGGMHALRVAADPGVERGACVLDVDAVRIDAQVGPALARLHALLGS